jgi:hypothetical protein
MRARVSTTAGEYVRLRPPVSGARVPRAVAAGARRSTPRPSSAGGGRHPGCCARDASRRGERVTITDHGAGHCGRFGRRAPDARKRRHEGVSSGVELAFGPIRIRASSQARASNSSPGCTESRARDALSPRPCEPRRAAPGNEMSLISRTGGNRPQPTDLQVTARSGGKRALSRHPARSRAPTPD